MQLGIGIGPNAVVSLIIEAADWPTYIRSGADWRIVQQYPEVNPVIATNYGAVSLASAPSPVPVALMANSRVRLAVTLLNTGSSRVGICASSATGIAQAIVLPPGKQMDFFGSTDGWYAIADPNIAASVSIVEKYWANGRLNAVATKTFFSITLTQSTSAQLIAPANATRKELIYMNHPANITSFAECASSATAFVQGVPYAPGEGNQLEVNNNSVYDGAVYGIVPTGASVVVNGWEVS